jgi:hypothetical protein
MPDLQDDAFEDRLGGESWPLSWQQLDGRERWYWFERLWFDACRLRDRYELPIRRGWWENQIALEALAAVAAWVSRYDTGLWHDPPGKLALLYDLERVGQLLHDGSEPFYPDRDNSAFVAHMIALGCEPPDRLSQWPPDPFGQAPFEHPQEE